MNEDWAKPLSILMNVGWHQCTLPFSSIDEQGLGKNHSQVLMNVAWANWCITLLTTTTTTDDDDSENYDDDDDKDAIPATTTTTTTNTGSRKVVR